MAGARTVAKELGLTSEELTNQINPENINKKLPRWKDEYIRKQGLTLLQKVVREEKWNLVPYLLRNGADVNLVHENGEGSIAHDAINDRRTHPIKVLSTLITAKNINSRDGLERTPLFKAVGSIACTKLVPFLLEKGASLNLRNKDGENIVHTLVTSPMTLNPFEHLGTRDVEELLHLIVTPENIDTGDLNGHTPLHKAVFLSEMWCIPMLVKAGADIVAESESGDTPFTLLTNESQVIPRPNTLKHLIYNYEIDVYKVLIAMLTRIQDDTLPEHDYIVEDLEYLMECLQCVEIDWIELDSSKTLIIGEDVDYVQLPRNNTQLNDAMEIVCVLLQNMIVPADMYTEIYVHERHEGKPYATKLLALGEELRRSSSSPRSLALLAVKAIRESIMTKEPGKFDNLELTGPAMALLKFDELKRKLHGMSMRYKEKYYAGWSM